ncbi:MAG: hypothetical protein ACRD0F_01625 [Acidimicrobiales bacterium]
MTGRLRAVLGATGAGVALSLLAASPAAAEFTANTVGCSGSATIRGPGGSVSAVNATDREVKVPSEGSADWRGALTTVTHDHSGEISLSLGLFDFSIDRWGPSRNAGNESSRTGTQEIPGFVAQLPAGKYYVEGFHRGTEGECAGFVVVDIGGGPFGNAAGIGALVATAASAAGLAVASRGRAPR